MKKIFYFFLAFALPLSVFAQPVIDSAEFYHVGQHFNYRFCRGATPGPSGASQSWDFTSVIDSTLAPIDVISASAPANVSLEMGGTTYYYNVSDTETVLTGIDMAAANISYFPSYILLVKHPIAYLDTASNAFTDSVYVSNPPIPGTGTSFMNVDAYGTLKTPEAVYDNTLRVKSTHSEHDAGLIGTEDVSFTSYLWYDSSHTFALMRIDSVVGVGDLPLVQVSAAYYTTDTPTVVRNVTSNTITANTHFDNNGLVLKTALQQGQQYKIGLINLHGQIVYMTTFTASGSLERFNFNNQMPTGTYFLSVSELKSGRQVLATKVMKQ